VLGVNRALEITSDPRTRLTCDELTIKRCLKFLYKLPVGLLRALWFLEGRPLRASAYVSHYYYYYYYYFVY
jgi:hypothetical protein